MDRHDRGDLRSALIDAGLRLSRHRGADALGIRELTREIGVSPAAVYRHFPNQRALVGSVALEAEHRLSRAVSDRIRTAPGGGDPASRAVGQLRAFALGYIGFALAEPGWFALSWESQRPCGVEGAEPAPSPRDLLLGALQAMVDVGALRPERQVPAEWSCWSVAHGYALLATTGPLQDLDRPAAGRLADLVVDTVIDGLRG